ncbi:VOC family protein [Falsigemmobacter faecalis]|uniref:VOC family protein n=1 Tax=Falsigemmobacter faecalis TaxID=2488730 RepID=A0A3P3DQB1_9RHOB|nr:VOC family protein [Falsigemmobacter faecalis]RRH76341.1 VOC family protein [Falsigemmobacter faecalis]
MLRPDHLVISAEALSGADEALAALFGAEFSPGGQHPLMSTHNRLLSLGPDEYLELIAIDPGAPPPGHPRWFGLDHFRGPPRLTHWVCRCDDLEAALLQAPAGAGRATALSRGDLHWQMAVTESGTLPFDDSFPALISWQGSTHPAQRLPDHGIRLRELQIFHPEAQALSAALSPLLTDSRIAILQGPAGLSALFTTADGELRL